MTALVLALAFQKGIALGLFNEDRDFDYGPLIDEIAAAGATHVSIVVPWYQDDVRAVRIAPHPRFSPQEAAVARAVRRARAAGLRVLLSPIVRVLRQATPDDWRGTLAPSDPDAWWASYRGFILRHARLGARAGTDLLLIGSELGSLDGVRAPWERLAREARRAFRGELVYAANWDGFARVAFWDLVDHAGLSGYFQIAAPGGGAAAADLVASWRDLRVRLLRAAAAAGRPLLVTEVGYLSQDGAAERPWDEAALGPVDLEQQRRCVEAFARAWDGARGLAGVYFWNWYGWGGARSREYTPRGKPAAREICRWYGGARCPDVHGMPWRER